MERKLKTGCDELQPEDKRRSSSDPGNQALISRNTTLTSCSDVQTSANVMQRCTGMAEGSRTIKVERHVVKWGSKFSFQTADREI